MEQRDALWVLGHKITPERVSGSFDMVTGETPPNVPGPPPHHHKKLSELFFVLEGEMEFIVNGEPVLVKKGESIDFPAKTVHTFCNAGQTPCKWLNIHSPKGFLGFFREFGIPESEPNAPNKSVDEAVIQKVMKEAAGFDMLIETK